MLFDAAGDRNPPMSIVLPENPGLPRRGFSLPASPAYASATARRAPVTVVPLAAMAQREGQLGPVLASRPSGRQIQRRVSEPSVPLAREAIQDQLNSNGIPR